MKVYIETYGCALNKGDSYIMMTLLKESGHEIVENYSQADAIILNTCAVRLETEERMKQRIKELRKIGKKLVIAGCLVSSEPALVMNLAPESSLVGAQSVDKIVEAVESPTRRIFLEDSKELITPRVFEGKISIIPIADGCAGDCNFCITKLARKKLRSYPPRSIVNAVKEAITNGAVEIELTAQDTAAYGLDINYSLPELIKDVLEIEGNYMIRIGMMTPELAMKEIDDIIEIMKDRRVYKFLHLPVQSGDDRVLKLMNRKYTVDEYKQLIKEIRNKIPLVNITTDIIIGHPGEDEEAFNNTLGLIKELKFERIHLAMYSIRPNTKSALMPQVPDPVKKERMRIANKVYEDVAYSVHSEYIGSNSLVITTEYGKKGSIIGRTINYIPVIVKDYNKLGDWINVKITEASFFDLRGQLIQ
ncbi:tRNA (N(6)-L-threonylcarbamoyladenosine(37)-C(2))-methylthiotran sferase [Sulfurisphaera javensis]|uniref:tRNA-t(6)A37 methylthiotransferase n=2 Tax=Sulfurisphaera javensis TaxID=2049879 RepID=A0AAT9GRL0_9CREN